MAVISRRRLTNKGATFTLVTTASGLQGSAGSFSTQKLNILKKYFGSQFKEEARGPITDYAKGVMSEIRKRTAHGLDRHNKPFALLQSDPLLHGARDAQGSSIAGFTDAIASQEKKLRQLQFGESRGKIVGTLSKSERAVNIRRRITQLRAAQGKAKTARGAARTYTDRKLAALSSGKAHMPPEGGVKPPQSNLYFSGRMMNNMRYGLRRGVAGKDSFGVRFYFASPKDRMKALSHIRGNASKGLPSRDFLGLTRGAEFVLSRKFKASLNRDLLRKLKGV